MGDEPTATRLRLVCESFEMVPPVGGVRLQQRERDGTARNQVLQAGNTEVHGTHHMMWARGLLWCRRCGFYTTVAADKKGVCKKLQRPCMPPTTAGLEYRCRLVDDLMPKAGQTAWPDGTLARTRPGGRKRRFSGG